LPLLLPKLHAFFRELLINEEANFWNGWFSFEDVPLKWQFPVGLLFDIYSGNTDRLQDENGHGPKKQDFSPVDSNNGAEAPGTWQLTLHFEDWPSEVLVKLDQDAKVLKDAFTNSYKEASFARYSSTKVVQRLSMEDAMQLWESVEKHNFTLFSPVNQKMIRPRDVEVKHIPLKVYLPSAASDDDETSTTPGHLRVIQGLVSPQISSRA
jgi:autophagy-related protein 5